MQPTKSEILILGGGVIGLSCALLLLRAGRGVTLLDKGVVGHGSSRGNCGTITPSHLPLHAPGTVGKALKWMLKRDAPFYVKPTLDPELLGWMLNFARRCNEDDFRRTAHIKTELLLRSRERLGALIRDEQLDCEFVDSGTLYVWRTEQALAKAHRDYEMLREVGVSVELLDGPALRAKEPALKDGMAGGHWHSGDARLRPDRYMAELARAVRAAGGTILEQTAVQGFRRNGERLSGVSTTQGEIDADEVVLALGAWSPQLGKQLGLHLPIQPGKGYSITYSRPQRGTRIPLVLQERSVCVTGWDSGYRLGSTMEFSGYDTTLNQRRLDALKRGAAEYLEEPEGPAVEEQWYGWRPMTYDDLPIIGRAPGVPNLTLATGHGMLGVSLSAITAQLVMESLTGRAPSLDPAPYRPERFAR
ncbi:MAG: D-amino acid dehydrogenase small subunit [Nevskia sp.]|nr:D-amino acid dehydrogenase small subunit [Nevskia sp.]